MAFFTELKQNTLKFYGNTYTKKKKPQNPHSQNNLEK